MARNVHLNAQCYMQSISSQKSSLIYNKYEEERVLTIIFII